MRDQPSSPDSEYSPDGKNDKMRARGGSQFGGATIFGGMNNGIDANCRRDLPSPPVQRDSRSESPNRDNTSPREPKSPPKSVRFTEEDEVIDQSSTKKAQNVRNKSQSSKPLSPSIKSSHQASSESESHPVSSSKQDMSSPDMEEDDYDEEENGSSSDDEPIDKNLLNKLDNIKKNLRENNTSQSHQFESQEQSS